jgi:hypothetical protein
MPALDPRQPPEVSVSLVHWPCWNQKGEIVCTNVTNFDIHDIARACRSFGVGRYFIVNRQVEQQMFVHRVLDHWRVGEGSEHNPMRKSAIEMIHTAGTIEDAVTAHKVRPLVIGTAARDMEQYPKISFKQLRERMWFDRSRPTMILLGTGWGLHSSALEQCDYILEPVKGSSPDDYRHLSVRSAASIILDRLLGQ